MNAIAARFNSARFHCMQRICAVPHAQWNDSITFFVPESILHAIECFVAEDFASVDELIAALTLAAEQVQTRLVSPATGIHAYIKRTYGTEPAALDASTRATCQDFIRSLHETPHEQTPLVPYRKVLTQAEAKQIWRDFDNERLLLPKGIVVDKLDLVARQATLIDLGINTLFNISPASYAGYELAVSWLDEMYSGNDTYWTSKEYTWYIYADGHGYSTVAGDLLRETEGDKAFSAYLARKTDMLSVAAQQKQPEAAASWTAVRAHYSDEPTFLYDRVEAELRLGDFGEAERVAEQLRATAGGEGLGLYQLSVVREAQGRTSEVIAFAAQAGQISEKDNHSHLVVAARNRLATLAQAEHARTNGQE